MLERRPSVCFAIRSSQRRMSFLKKIIQLVVMKITDSPESPTTPPCRGNRKWVLDGGSSGDKASPTQIIQLNGNIISTRGGGAFSFCWQLPVSNEGAVKRRATLLIGHFYFVTILIPVHMTTTNAALRVIKSTTTEQVAVTCTNDDSPPHIILDCPVLACNSKTARRWLSRPCCRFQTQLAWQQRSHTSSPFLSPSIPFP